MTTSPSETNVPRISPVPRTSGTAPYSVVNVQHAGLVTGLVFAGWHLLWSACVASGFAQRLLDFVFWMHFIKPVYIVEPFSWVRALTLIIVTGVVGYVLGAVFAFVWNRVHRP